MILYAGSPAKSGPLQRHQIRQARSSPLSRSETDRHQQRGLVTHSQLYFAARLPNRIGFNPDVRIFETNACRQIEMLLIQR